MPSGRTLAPLLVLLASGVLAGAAGAAVPKHIVFPVVGKVSYQDDFGDPRPGRTHQGNDIMGRRHQLAVAAEGGTVKRWWQPGTTGLCMLYLYGRSGTTYLYIHLNNDRTQRNDNTGGCKNGIAYAPGLRDGQHVRRGQLLGYIGDSGDANGIQPHVHFELHPRGGAAISPYGWLRRGRHLLYASPKSVERVWLVLTGKVRWTSPRLNVAVRRSYSSTKRLALVWKNVGIDVPDDVVVVRKTSDGRTQPAKLASARPGDRFRLLTRGATPSFATQAGVAGAWTARRIVLLPD